MLFTIAVVFGLSSFPLQNKQVYKTDTCQFTLVISDSLLNKKASISRFAVSGVKNKLALKFRTDLGFKVGEDVLLDEAFFTGIRTKTCDKKYVLKQVTVMDEALLESDAVFMLFFLEKR